MSKPEITRKSTVVATFDRRQFLGAAATVPFASAAITANASSPDQHQEWLVRWRVLMEEDFQSEAEYDFVAEEIDRLASLICNTSANSVEGQWAQIEWLKEDLGDYIVDGVSNERGGVFNVLFSSVEATFANQV